MESECEFLKTSITSYKCAENDLDLSILRINPPCSHMLYKGAEYPSLSDVNIKMKISKKLLKCIFDKNIVNIQVNPTNGDDNDFLKDEAINAIAR